MAARGDAGHVLAVILWVQSGAGIVIDSVPATEYIETWNKVAASVQSARIAQMLRSSFE